MQYIWERTVFGWCWWDLVALVILVGVIVVAAINLKKMREQRKELEDRLSDKSAAAAVAEDSAAVQK